jgi:methyl-accepting chemotaxis protein
LSQNRKRDGENIWEAKDANGEAFVQHMIEGGKELPEGVSAIKYYPWQNKGESRARMKVAAYTRFEEWGWTIGPSAYMSEFTGSLDKVRNITIFVSLISIILGVIISYSFATMITKNLKKILANLAQMEMGDLTQKLSVTSSMPEIRTLGGSIESTRSRIAQLLTSVIDTTNTAATNAEQLSASAQEVNASVQQVSSTVQEISKSAQELSKNASDAATKSKMTEQSSTTGSAAAQSVMGKWNLSLPQQRRVPRK